MEAVIQHPGFLTDLLMLVSAGLLAGFIAGLFGVGGGTVTVPILFHWYVHMGVQSGTAMHVAVATSLATIITTSLVSSHAHRKNNAIDETMLYVWGPFICLGSVFGVILAAIISGDAMRGIFGSFLICIALYMLFSQEGKAVFHRLPGYWGQRCMAAGIGGLSSLVGVGGGAISVPVMSVFGVNLRHAVGTSSAFGFLIAVPGTIGFILSGLGAKGLPPYTLGYVSLLGLAALLPTTALTAPLGAKIAHKLDRSVLRRVFALFLTFVSAKMLWGLLTH